MVGRPSWRVGIDRKVLPQGPGVVWKPSRSVENGREALPEGREWSGGPLGWSGLVVRPYRKDREWSGGPSGVLRVVARLSRRAGTSRDALPVSQEWSGVLPKEPVLVGRPYRKGQGGRETLPECRV